MINNRRTFPQAQAANISLLNFGDAVGDLLA
jgi:hypothetical protein